jgi:hypothetical protein
MSFVTLGALAIALLVVAPVAAHLLRRRSAEERPFPAARLVPASPPVARRRSLLEDRALFAIRALAVIALAVLGATPFVRCSRLAISRRAGASVALAIVVDDSMSMRAAADGGPSGRGEKTRFERAKESASELLGSSYAGDAVAIVLAGAPARVALASTTNITAAKEALAAIEPSDRATDLDGAVALAHELLKGLVQPDKRIVVLSDLADGNPDGAAIGGERDVDTWVPLAELRAKGADCGVTRADRAGPKVRARVVCTPPTDGSADPAAGRALEIRRGDEVLGSVRLAPGSHMQDLAVDLRESPDAKLRAVLTGPRDVLGEDDEAPVVPEGGALAIATIVDPASTRVVTGGPPPIEQAFAALELDAAVRPLPSVPEHAEELGSYAALIVDDAPGFTPEVRRSLAAWVEHGGVVLLTLGPRAASAPLGASFDPLVPGVVRWSTELRGVEGIEPGSAPSFGPTAVGLEKLAPHGRALLTPAAIDGADVLAKWKDGSPLLIRRPVGRGAVLALTLPLSTDESDLALRPAFLSLLDRVVSVARSRGGARRIDAGESWTFDGFEHVTVRASASGASVPVTRVDGRLRAAPGVAGPYDLDLDGDHSVRVVSVPEREIDLRARRVADAAHAPSLGGLSEAIDASPYVALTLLGLLAAELFLRTLGQRAAEEAESSRSRDVPPESKAA